MTFVIKSMLTLFVLAGALPAEVLAQNDTQSIITQLLAQPPASMVRLATETQDTLNVDFLRADLDGSGKFQFIVASYSFQHDGEGIFLRIFQQRATGLLLVGEQEDEDMHGGFGISVNLVDINGDGIPEIDLQGHEANGRQVFDEYFTWTGHSLHSSIDATADSSLVDIDGDGIQELVRSNGDGSFNIYKYNGIDFTLSQTMDHDPEGVLGSGGKVHIVRARFSALRPHDFDTDEIMAAVSKDQDDNRRGSERDDDDGRVRLMIGSLQDLRGKNISVEAIDTATLVLQRNLHPLSFKIRPPDKDDHEGDSDNNKRSSRSVLQLEFRRGDILRLLPHLKLTAPLASGDELRLLLFGKLRNGTRVSATTSATIHEDRDDRERSHQKDKPKTD